MNFALLAVGLGLLAFPALAARRSGRLPSAEWARVAVSALVLGAICLYTGILLTALPLVFHLLQMEGVLAICDPVVHNLMLGGAPIGWSAFVLAVILTSIGALTARQSRHAARAARIEPWLGHHSDQGDHELVVIPTTALVAVGVPGDPPQVVISEGLVRELDAPQLQAVIGHEVSHLRLRHRRSLVATAIIERTFGVVPFIRSSAVTVRESLEVWADDFAIHATYTTSRALRAALQSVAGDHEEPGNVRVDRLAGPAPCLSAASRGLTYLPVGALAAGAAALLIGWTLNSQHMVALSGAC